MSSNPLTPSFRRVHLIPDEAAHPAVRQNLRDNDKSITDLNQAVISLKAQVTAAAAAAAPAASENTTTETVSESWQYLGSVNNQLGESSYTTQQSDDGAKILCGDSTAVSVTLNPAVTLPWFAIIGNDSTSGVSLFPGSGAALSGIQVIDPGCFVFVHYDGGTFWSEGLQLATDSTSGIVQPDGNTIVVDPATGLLETSGYSGTVVTAALTALGAQGSMVFVQGLLVSQTPAT